MVPRPVLALVVLLGSVRLARADDSERAATLRGRGDELARRGEYADAIAAFKAADRASPRAAHACLIALAYLRRSLWPQAELYLARCERRRTASDPIPEWIDDARAQLAAGLAAAPVTTVEVRIEPASVAAMIRVSAFPDDVFDPQPIHLQAGRYTIEVAAPGFATVTRAIELDGKGRRVIEVELEAARRPVVEIVAAKVNSPVRPWAMRFAVTSGVAAVGAIALHVLAARTRADLGEATTLDAYRARETRFDLERASAISLYGVAAITGGLALYLRARVELGAQLSSDRTVVTLGWRR
ncbi:MAG: hypothetical protein ABI867_04605 [Kofleriaceae bacterium]